MRNFGQKIDNTAPLDSGILSAEEDNVRFEEMENLVTSSGQALDPAGGPDTDKRQMAQAAARYASGGVHGEDAGAADAYVINATGDFQPPKAYFDGMEVAFTPGNTNTGASTINAWGLGTKPLHRPAGIALTGGEVVAGRLTAARYHAASGAMRIVPWAVAQQAVDPGNEVLLNIGDGEDLYAGPDAQERHQIRGIKGINGLLAALNGDNVDMGLSFPPLVEEPTFADDDIFVFYDDSEDDYKTISGLNLRTFALPTRGLPLVPTAYEILAPDTATQSGPIIMTVPDVGPRQRIEIRGGMSLRYAGAATFSFGGDSGYHDIFEQVPRPGFWWFGFVWWTDENGDIVRWEESITRNNWTGARSYDTNMGNIAHPPAVPRVVNPVIAKPTDDVYKFKIAASQQFDNLGQSHGALNPTGIMAILEGY